MCTFSEGGLDCEWSEDLQACFDRCSYTLDTCESCGECVIEGDACVIDDSSTGDDPTTAQPSEEPTPVPPPPSSALPTTAQPSPEPTRSPLTIGETFNPTETPTNPPTFPKCETADQLDIGFLMDESGSVSAEEWEELKDFVKLVIAQDISQDSYVALWEYASYPAWTQFAEWSLVSTSTNSLTNKLTNNRHSIAGLTMTWDAVNRVLDTMFNHSLECTDGCEKRPDVLFLLTDGVPTDTVCPDMTARMQQSPVDIVVIIIGSALIEDKVSCLDVADNGADVYRIERFGPAELNELEEKVRAKTCTGQFEDPQGERPDPADRWVYPDGSTGLGPVPEADGNDGSGCKPNCDDTPSPILNAVVNSGSGTGGGNSNDAMVQGEGVISEGTEANAVNGVGTVQNGLYIGAAAVFVIALIGAGTYFAFKKAANKEKFVNSVMNSMADVDVADGASFEIGASQDLEMLATGTPSVGPTGHFAE